MVDKDTREIEAIGEVFPDAEVLLCYFHVLQVTQTIYVLHTHKTI